VPFETPHNPPLPQPPFYKRGWFWGVVGGLAATAVVTGVVIAESQQSGVPATILYPTK
jgi:hypothetical protein